jgi:hypothetical protein
VYPVGVGRRYVCSRGTTQRLAAMGAANYGGQDSASQPAVTHGRIALQPLCRRVEQASRPGRCPSRTMWHAAERSLSSPSNVLAISCNSLPRNGPLLFSSERQGRLRAYHGREEPRAQPAASRHEPTFARTGVAFCRQRPVRQLIARQPSAQDQEVSFDTVEDGNPRKVAPLLEAKLSAEGNTPLIVGKHEAKKCSQS